MSDITEWRVGAYSPVSWTNSSTSLQYDILFPLPCCRIGTDLVLWKPASPQSVEKANTAKSMFFSTMDIIQPAVTKEERYQLCKSVLKEGTGP